MNNMDIISQALQAAPQTALAPTAPVPTAPVAQAPVAPVVLKKRKVPFTQQTLMQLAGSPEGQDQLRQMGYTRGMVGGDQKTTNEQTDGTKKTEGTTIVDKANIISDPAWQNMEDRVIDSPLPGAKAARQATEGIKSQISNVAQSPLRMQGVDLRPLAGLLDSWYGTKLSASTPAPETTSDRAQLLAQMEERLADNAAKQQHFENMLMGNMQFKQPSFTTQTAQAVGTTQNKNTQAEGMKWAMQTPTGSSKEDDIHKQVQEYDNELTRGNVGPVVSYLKQIDGLMQAQGGKPPSWWERTKGDIPGGYFGSADYNQAYGGLVRAMETATYGKRFNQVQLAQAQRELASAAGASPDRQMQALQHASDLIRQGMQMHENSAFSGRLGPQVKQYIDNTPGYLRSADIPTFQGGAPAQAPGSPQAPSGTGMTPQAFLKKWNQK